MMATEPEGLETLSRTIAAESPVDFIARLQRIAEDWRYSDEFIGVVVHARWPRVHPGDRR